MIFAPIGLEVLSTGPGNVTLIFSPITVVDGWAISIPVISRQEIERRYFFMDYFFTNYGT
jgi:hypothetical protein